MPMFRATMLQTLLVLLALVWLPTTSTAKEMPTRILQVILLTSIFTFQTQATEKGMETLCAPSPSKENKTRESNFEFQGGLQMALLEAKIAALEARVAAQGAYNAAQDARIAAQDAKVTSCERWRSAQEDRDREIKLQLHSLIAERNRTVSFLAVHTTRQTVSANGIVKFSTVRHNSAPSGFGYDPVINHFRCPVTGQYAFFFGVRTYQCGGDFHFGIMKGAAILNALYGHIPSSNCHQTSLSASAVTACGKGEYVYVRNIDAKNHRNLYSDGSGYVYFTGFLI